jgi:predicted cupin superfamily sugar epimerase
MTVPELAVALDLAPHPEGGWYRRTWTSTVFVETPAGPRPSATAVLYLLDGVSRWHRVRSAELWCWHRGSAVELRHGGTGPAPSSTGAGHTGAGHTGPEHVGPEHVGPGHTGPEHTDDPVGAPTLHRLDGDRPQVEIPAGTWQTARLLGPDPALVTCVVSPGFDFADFELLPP